MPCYKLFNGPMPTTAAQLAVTTGTGIKTLLQIKPFIQAKVVAWGLSFDGAAAAAGIQCELLSTGTVFATVTAYADADIHKWQNAADQVAASVGGLTLGTSASGYTASAEGTITATKIHDSQFVQPTGQYAWEFSLGREPIIAVGDSGRIRVKAAAAVNAIAWMLLEF